MFIICVKEIIYLLLYNLHDRSFNLLPTHTQQTFINIIMHYQENVGNDISKGNPLIEIIQFPKIFLHLFSR